MGVKKEYKHTEVGIIPKDWNIVNIIDKSTLKARIGWQGLTTKEYLSDGEYYLVTGTDFFDGQIKWETCHYVDCYRYIQDKNIQLKENDILITKDGTIGKVAFIDKLPSMATLNSGVFVIRPIEEGAFYPLYLFYIFCSDYFADFLRKLVAGSTINHLYQKDFVTFNFPLPYSLKEQQAIATALSDMDELINELERLIEKKRNIKQGAMQKLLRPKKNWQEIKIKELGNTYGGLSGKSKQDFINGNYPYIPFMNIMSSPIININHFDFVHIAPYENQNKALQGDLFFNGSSETPEELGMCSVLLTNIPNLYLNSFCFGFRFHKNITTNGHYFAYFFRSNYGRKVLCSLSQGATRHNLSKRNFLNTEILVPKIEEQIHIASTLSDMDTEIDSLETQLAKYKEIKTGMMQELLTGKTRLI